MEKSEIIETLNENGLKLVDLDDHYKADKEMVILAIKENPYAIQFAAPQLRDDIEILESAYQRHCTSVRFKNPGKKSIIEYASPALQNNMEHLLRLLKYDSSLIHSFPYHYLQEEYFMKQAVSRNGTVIRYASQEIKNNRAIVLEAAKENGIFLQIQSFQQFVNDREIMMAACISHAGVIELLLDEFKNDLSFVVELLKNADCGGNAIRHLPAAILQNKEVIFNGFILNKYLLLAVIRNKILLNDDAFILMIFEKFPPNHNFIKVFCQLLLIYWRKHELPEEDINNVLRGKLDLIKKITEINPATVIFFQKYL